MPEIVSDTPAPGRLLSRAEASAFLTARGFPVAVRTLACLATRGGGPRFRHFGRRVLYEPADLLEWAERRTSAPIGSTSEARNAA